MITPLATRALIAFGLALAGAAHGQAPTGCKSPRLIIAYPAGGPTDTQGRIIAQRLSERWGQQIVIENRGGGGTVVATAIVEHLMAARCC